MGIVLVQLIDSEWDLVGCNSQTRSEWLLLHVLQGYLRFPETPPKPVCYSVGKGNMVTLLLLDPF